MIFAALSIVATQTCVPSGDLKTRIKNTTHCYNPRIGGGNGILLPKLFWPTVRKICSSDREKLLKFEDEGQEFANYLRTLD